MSEQQTDAIRGLVQQVIAEHGDPDDPGHRGIVTGFVLIAETVGDDGEPYMSVFTEAPLWRGLGLVEAAAMDLRDDLTRVDEDND